MLPAGAGGAVLEETISLYLELEPGKKADFEVVGRAAAAFAEVVREIAFNLEPGLEIKLEFDSGTEGSISLNGILKSPADKRAAVIAIAVVVGGWFVQDLRTYGVGKFMDAYLMPEQKNALSDDDIDRIAKRLKNVMDGKLAKEPAQQVYRELERDKAIKSVGTVTKVGTKPPNPVPREQFQTVAGVLPSVQTTPKKRKKTTRERLTLISPVLIEGKRHWRFQTGAGESGYAIDDEKFLKSLLSGKRKIPMKEGIQITALVDTFEENEGEVWVIKDRRIVTVERVHRVVTHGDLFVAPKPKKTKPRKK
jgi:hypothetical protein